MASHCAARCGACGETSLTGHAFGVGVTGADTLVGLVPGSPPRHRTTLTLGDEQLLASRWPVGGARRLIERRWPSGALFLAVDEHPRYGFRIEAPGHGTHVVSPDGSTWAGAVVGEALQRWHELVYTQVLPTIAALQGLEPLHASAVAKGGDAYGVIAPSGIGKSSTAAHLVSLGAQFVSDDVLALELLGGRLVAHPGPRLVKLHEHEITAIAPAARPRLGTSWGESDGKLHLRPSGVEGPLALAGLLFLERTPGGDQVTVEPLTGSVPRLLASAYAPHVSTPARLERQLDVFAAAHREAVLWRVLIPPQRSATDVAAALWPRLTRAAEQ